MTAPITVLTVTIRSREHLLADNIQSIYNQTIPVERQLICAHPSGKELNVEPMIQYANAKNTLLRAADTEWVAILNDDDTWLPHHVETVLPHLDNTTDILYTWDAGNTRPRVNVNDWPHERLWRVLEQKNIIDANCLIRRHKLKETGGFPIDWVGGAPRKGGHYQHSPAIWDDWELWRRMVRAHARFRCVPVETWRHGTAATVRICG